MINFLALKSYPLTLSEADYYQNLQNFFAQQITLTIFLQIPDFAQEIY